MAPKTVQRVGMFRTSPCDMTSPYKLYKISSDYNREEVVTGYY